MGKDSLDSMLYVFVGRLAGQEVRRDRIDVRPGLQVRISGSSASGS
jgi:hypothetical protein